ncbi:MULTISPECIES: helix-turn-helix domain-containing protein [Cupriavidus]
METSSIPVDSGPGLIQDAADDSVAETAGLCGFGSATGFSEVFRRIVGVFPTAWRAEQRK